MIPQGKVMTYGQIASIAGNKWGSRQVARLLSSSSDKYQLPWHRVVNRYGKVSIYDNYQSTQIKKLLQEHIFVQNGIVDLNIYLFDYNKIGDSE